MSGMMSWLMDGKEGRVGKAYVSVSLCSFRVHDAHLFGVAAGPGSRKPPDDEAVLRGIVSVELVIWSWRWCV
jgi:hypothetical protein